MTLDVLSVAKDAEVRGEQVPSSIQGRELQTWNSFGKYKYFQTFKDKTVYYLQFLIKKKIKHILQ